MTGYYSMGGPGFQPDAVNMSVMQIKWLKMFLLFIDDTIIHLRYNNLR